MNKWLFSYTKDVVLFVVLTSILLHLVNLWHKRLEII